MPVSGNILPPTLRGFVTDNNTGVRTEITDDITNWRELGVKHARKDFSGVFVSIQEALEVCRSGKDILRNAFRAYMMAMNMTFEILKHGPKDFIYSLVHSMRLNVGTYEEHRDHISIGGIAITFDSLVKSVGKTKYDIPVENLATGKWQYGHNEVFVSGKYTIPEGDQTMFGAGSAGGPVIGGAFLAVTETLSIYFEDGKMPFGGADNDFRAQGLSAVANTIPFSDTEIPLGQIDNLPDEYFFMADPDGGTGQEIRLRFKFRLQWDVTKIPSRNYSPYFFVHQRLSNSNDVAIVSQYLSGQPANAGSNLNWVDFDYDEVLTIPAGAKLRMFVYFYGAGNSFPITITNFEYFDIKYVDKSKLVDTIPVVMQRDFANALLDKMSNGDPAKKYTATIDTDTDSQWLFNHYLVAAESIRGFKEANFHANFNDFVEYMQFLGYEYEVDESEKIVHFRKRSYFFNPDLTAMTLEEYEVANVVIRANDEYAYSTVRVGYEKPDIEDTNGRFAVCGAFDYSTDYSNLGDLRDSSLEIICPYKADPVEIEILSWTRGEKTKDEKADNDIFMLAGDFNGLYVTESRRAQYTVSDPDTGDTISWFNVPYIPYFIAKRNTGRIGVAVRNLTFTGTDAYREAGLSGVSTDDIYSDMSVTDGLFLPITYEFEAGTHQGLPPQDLRAGLIRFTWRGRQYRGYIQELVKNYAAEQGESWVLRAR